MVSQGSVEPLGLYNNLNWLVVALLAAKFSDNELAVALPNQIPGTTQGPANDRRAS